MAVDLFLVVPASTSAQITADPGSDPYFKSTFGKAAVVQLRQFSFGTESKLAVGSASSGAGVGKIQFNEFVVEKSVDALSRSLFKMSATGLHLPRVQLYLRDPAVAGGKPHIAYGFSMVYVSKIDWSAGAGDDQATERVNFVYGGLAVGFYPKTPAGQPASPLQASWNQVTNTAEVPADTLADF